MVARFRSIKQPPEVGLQVDRIVFARLAIDSCGSVLPGSPEGFLHPFKVQVVGQAGECHVRGLPGQHCYSLLFR
jgi:hypothetical protein